MGPPGSEDDASGFPLRDEALADPGPTQPLEPLEPVDPGPRRGPRPSVAWALLIVLFLALGGMGAAYAITQRNAGSPPPAAASPPPPAVAPPPPAPAPAPPTASGTAPTQPTTTASPPAPPQTVVPKVVGYQLAAAIAMLRRAGLGGTVRRVSSPQPNGRVVGQNPQAGAKEAKNGRVELEVAVQPPVVVPDVVGMSGLEAHHTLTADHLLASIRYVPSGQPARTVVAQHPLAGTKVKRGSGVLINVSSGGGPTGPTGSG